MPVWNSFDIHVCMAIDPAPQYKSQARYYMATFLDGPGQNFPDFRRIVVMPSRKLGLIALGRVDGFDKGFDQYYTACEADERAEGDVGFLAT
jgi:hypothetical protein